MIEHNPAPSRLTRLLSLRIIHCIQRIKEHRTLFSDDARTFQVALVSDNDDGFRVSYLVADGVQQVDSFLVRSSVGDGVDNDIGVDVVFPPRV